MADAHSKNSIERSAHAQARWGVLRSAMLQGDLKEQSPKTQREKVQSNLAIFTGFALRAVEKGWLKRRAEDGTLLKPMEFDDIEDEENERTAQEAMDGKRDSDFVVRRLLTAEEAEKYRVEVRQGSLADGEMLVWCHDNEVLRVKKGEAVDTTKFKTKNLYAKLAYVVDSSSQIYIFPHGSTIGITPVVNDIPPTKKSTHMGVLAGAPVINAGLIGVRRGKIDFVSDDSGHYQPLIANMVAFLKKLLPHKSLFSDDAIVDVFDVGRAMAISQDTVKILENLSQIRGEALRTLEKGCEAIDVATRGWLERMVESKGANFSSDALVQKDTFMVKDYSEMMGAVGETLENTSAQAQKKKVRAGSVLE